MAAIGVRVAFGLLLLLGLGPVAHREFPDPPSPPTMGLWVDCKCIRNNRLSFDGLVGFGVQKRVRADREISGGEINMLLRFMQTVVNSQTKWWVREIRD